MQLIMKYWPIWHCSPVKPTGQMQRYCFSVNPVWQVAFLAHGCRKQPFWKNAPFCYINIYSSNTSGHFLLGIRWWTSIPSRGSSNTLRQFMLGVMWWTIAPQPEWVVIVRVSICLVSCDGLASHPGESSNTLSHFILGILWWTSIPPRGEW